MTHQHLVSQIFVELHYVWKKRMYNEIFILNQLLEDRCFYYKTTITTSFNCQLLAVQAEKLTTERM